MRHVVIYVSTFEFSSSLASCFILHTVEEKFVFTFFSIVIHLLIIQPTLFAQKNAVLDMKFRSLTCKKESPYCWAHFLTPRGSPTTRKYLNYMSTREIKEKLKRKGGREWIGWEKEREEVTRRKGKWKTVNKGKGNVQCSHWHRNTNLCLAHRTWHALKARCCGTPC